MKRIFIEKRNLFHSKTSQNLLMLFSLILILIGLYLPNITTNFISEIVIGTGILTSGYAFMKLSNK